MPATEESENYAFTLLRVGGTIRNKATGQEVYFQPGDDVAAMIENVEVLDEVSPERRSAVFDVLCSQYV